MTLIDGLTVALIGNFEPEHSTENEYRRAWESLGATVLPVQEGNTAAFEQLIYQLSGVTLIQWTRTKSLSDRIADVDWWRLLRLAGRADVPVVGVHLDKWWGLKREHELTESPYFSGVDILFTADGGHQDEWASIGVNHRWLLPAIGEQNLGIGTPRDEYRSKVAFVGNWDPRGGYHREAKHRYELIQWLDRTYKSDVKFWPRRGEHAIRGRELNDLYASVDVLVGDSAVLPGECCYSSDRIPETLGRGGVLIHPHVEGLTASGDPFEFVLPWQAGDWKSLGESIHDVVNFAAVAPEGHAANRQRLVDRIAEGHTYKLRCLEIFETLVAEDYL